MQMLQFVVASETSKRGPFRQGSLCTTVPKEARIVYEPSMDFHVFNANIKGLWHRYGYEKKNRCELKKIKAKIIIPKDATFRNLLKTPNGDLNKDKNAASKLELLAPAIFNTDLGSISVSSSTTEFINISSSESHTPDLSIPSESYLHELYSTKHSNTQKIPDIIEQKKDLRKPLNKIRNIFNNIKSDDDCLLLLPVSIDKFDKALYIPRIWSMLNSLEWHSILQRNTVERKIFLEKTKELLGIKTDLLFNLTSLVHPSEINKLPEELYKQVEKAYWAVISRPISMYKHYIDYVNEEQSRTLAFYTSWESLDEYAFTHLHNLRKKEQQNMLTIGKTLGDFVSNF